MGTNMNFKGFGNDPSGNNNLLARQSSIYSLTFEELQNTIGGSGKDFGSMNMDELLKSIWTAEETQILAPAGVAIGGLDGGGLGGVPLQRQGSLTLPRTLSQKTVDEVWKNISKEGSSNGPNLPQRQQTLGEMTLEEFLFKAGVVREDAQLGPKPSTNGGGAYFGDLSRFGNTGDLGSFEFPQPNRGGVDVMGARVSENTNQISNNGRVANPSSNLPLNANGVRSNQNQQHQQQLPQQQQIFPKQQTLTYSTSPLPMGPNAQLGSRSPGMRGGIMGIDQGLNGALVQSSGMGMVGLGGAGGAVRVPTGSPANQLSSDGVGKSNGTDTSSVSPVPYVFNGGFRGRKGGPVEKVVERRQRRMIKNRESAARSRARKQAYTMELEAEVAKLKEENQELQNKQDQMMEIQKNQDMDIINLQRGKKRCLRRTQTGPW